MKKNIKNTKRFKLEIWMNENDVVEWDTSVIKPSQLIMYGAVLQEVGLKRMGEIEEPIDDKN